MRAGIYARISEDREETQAGVERQVADCKKLLERLGWDLHDIYVDNDISAYKGKHRPEYQRMLDDIASGDLEAFAVYHQDRLHRRPIELEELFEICDRASLTHMATVSGSTDLSTDDGRMMMRVTGAVARNQSDAASRRIKRKALDLAEKGMPTGGGDRPFGFEPDRITVRESEAAVIRDLVERLLGGETLRSLAADLEVRGIVSPRGSRWRSTPLRRMLASGRISGQREHHGVIVARATWPAIVTPEQTEQIRRLFADPSRRAKRAARRYPLKGLLRCVHCNATLVARPRGDGSRRYVCASGPNFVGCGQSHALAEPVEEWIAEMVFDRLDTPELEAAIRHDFRAAASTTGIEAEYDRIVIKLDELALAYSDDELTMRDWITAKKPLQERHDALRLQLARRSNSSAIADLVGNGGTLRSEWPALGADRQHAIIAAVINHVTVGPGRRGYNRFDSSRFEIVFRR